jgi:response regulator RpfG family c-di-GMP phosphodiesterase
MEQTKASAEASEKLRVLIIDDEKNIRTTLSLCLEQMNCYVEAVPSVDKPCQDKSDNRSSYRSTKDLLHNFLLDESDAFQDNIDQFDADKRRDDSADAIDQ